jgi:ligand-binding sensor domain-containing protein/putative methionine-R-sulfoxide reductase with GAF domain
MLYDEHRFLVCADDGLRVFENNEFKKINLITKDSVKFISKIISCNKNLWLIGRLGGSMELVNKITLQTTAISPRLTVTQLYKDAQNNIWIATKDKGILYLNAADIAQNKLQLSAVPAALQFLSNSEINDITGDKEGNIYFATVGKGLIKMLPDKRIEIISTKNGLSSLHVRTAFADKEGNLWIGTNMGIDKLSINKLNIYNDRFGLQSNICYDASLYKNRYLITPNNLGFSVIDDHTKSINNFLLPVENESYPFRTFIADDDIYMLNKNSVSLLNTAFPKTNPYKKVIVFPNRINTLTTDHNKNILVAGYTGIWQINNNKPSLIINEPDVRTIMVDDSNVIWIGRYDNGIVGYQLLYNSKNITAKKLGTWKTSYNQDHSRILLKGNDHTIWYGTRFSGLYHLKFKDSLVLLKHFDAQNGLSSDFVQSLCLLPNGKLLAGTADGLDMIDAPNNYAVTTAIHKKFNFSSKINQIKFSENNLLWMATDDGIINLEIDQLENDKISPAPVYITGVKIKGIDTDNGLPAANTFKYNQNSVSFWFASPAYVNENNILYSWMLQGSTDTSWSEPAHTNTASFTDINPGKYVFNVKTIDGANGKTISKSAYTFLVEKPLWQNNWFIAMAVMVIGLLFYRFIKLREKNIAEREAQKTELQKLKTISYQYQLEIEQVVGYFASFINEKNSIEDLLWDVGRNCIAKLGFKDCVIYLKDNNRNVLIQKAAWGPKTTHENKIINAIEIPMGKGIVGSVALSGKPEIIKDTSKDNRYIKDDAIRLSEITVPILDDGKVIGVIDSEHPEQNFYTQRHLQILTTIASLCADKIDKIKSEQQTREKEVVVLKLSKDLATSQLTALRAQMNPHFIFNALNSVQQYILTGDVDQANKYLSKFSRLQREVLNHCDHNFISLDKEVEMLNLYLELEQLRFNENFEYSIHLSDEIDSSEIKIPPMILQPFVENAIWHGLMPKQTNRQIQISFTLSTYSYLCCTIKDNGIGREAAARLKEQSGNITQHKSKGLGLVYERLQILQQQYQQNFTVTIVDVTAPNGTVEGTEVELRLFIAN